MRALLTLALCAVAGTATAQGTTKAPAATKQDTKAAVTKQDTKAAATKQDTKTPATKQAAGTKQDAKSPAAPPAARPGLSVAPEAAPRTAIPPIMREVYDYDPSGRRDPFLSLLSSEDLRPAVTDLKLVNIIFDESGRRPIAVMRDVLTNTQYRVTTGSTLGRLKVALIKRRAVIFSIEEFGLNRQDSLVLGDTTKARVR
jgi:hypothetical protein